MNNAKWRVNVGDWTELPPHVSVEWETETGTLTVYQDTEGKIRVSVDGQLLIEPHASNVVYVRPEGRIFND